MSVTFDRGAEALLAPVRVQVDAGLQRLGVVDLAVRLGEVAGFFAVEGREVVLSASLASEGVCHPDEPSGPVPPLDRWRRAAASVIEGAAIVELAARLGQPPVLDWRWLGAAIDRAAAVVPELEHTVVDWMVAAQTGDPGANPRVGVAILAAWRARGLDPQARIAAVLGGEGVRVDEWLDLGAWVLAEAARRLPVPVERVAERDIPTTLTPWSWARLRVPGHPRGGVVRADGPGGVTAPWATADTELRTLAGALDAEVRLRPEAGGPVGSWEAGSAMGFGQIYGIRGITFEIAASGALQLVMADAFVGPLEALEISEQVGTSGIATGRWTVAGPEQVGFVGIRSEALTMHGRDGDPFAVPAGGMGIGTMLHALEDGPWQWKRDGDALVLEGALLGGRVEVRLRRV